MLTRYFETARQVIERFGGTVEKFIGDAVMAVWGTPFAREDDAERAVRAGLDLVEVVRALGDELESSGLSARAAVMTGEAAVTVGAEGQGLVAGDLVNTASRVQALADPGTVLVGERAYPSDRAFDCLRACRRARAQGTDGARAPLAGSASHVCPRRLRLERRARSAVRRP